MPGYWLTTHWPPYEGVCDPYNIYLQEHLKEVGLQLRIGDKMLIYEHESGPPVLRRMPDGSERKVRRERGRGGIICLADIASELQPAPEGACEEHPNRSATNWAWQALTANRVMGFVPRSKVNEILGYAPRYPFRGYNAGRGIKSIEGEGFAKLSALLVESARS